MLIVNGLVAQIKSARFVLSNNIHNKKTFGYCGYLEVKFEINGEKGYFDFFVDVMKDKNISYYENKEYCCIPIDNEKEIHYLEIFDTNSFYDVGTFYNQMRVKFGEIKNNRIKVLITIHEEALSIEFDDYIDIII